MMNVTSPLQHMSQISISNIMMDDENSCGSITPAPEDARHPGSTSLFESPSFDKSDLVARLLTGKKYGKISSIGHPPALKTQRQPSTMVSTVPQRHRGFLEPACSASILRHISPKSISEGENLRLKKIGLQSRDVYNWAGTTLHSADSYGRYERSSKSINMDTVVSKDLSINRSMKQWKMYVTAYV